MGSGTSSAESRNKLLPDRISVIMPCYNSESYLREAIESVLGQTYADVELIVVDDGSTDGSKAILREYGEQITVLEQENQGPYPARNLGLQHAHGEFVAFLDADDWWSLDCLEKLHLALINSNAVLVYCGWQNVGSSHRGQKPYIPPDYESGNKVKELLRGGAPWPIHAALCETSVIHDVGGFNVDMPTSMDFDLWLRIAASRNIDLVPEVLAYYRFHGATQISSKPWRQAINGWRIKRRFVDQNPDLVAGLVQTELCNLIDSALLQRGYDFYWRGDLVTSRHVFRKVLLHGGWKLPDLKYLLPALLPERAYVKLVQVLRG